MGLFSSIIGAVAGPLIGGLFGKKKDKPQEVVNRVDYGRMVKDAEAAGFNPLTALRNGGSAGFGVQSMPSMTSNNIWGDTAAAAFNAWNNYDPHAQKRESLSDSLMQAQLANIQADTALKMNPRSLVPKKNSFNVPVKLAAQTTSGTGLAASPAGLGRIKTPEEGDVTVTNPWEKYEVNPKIRDAEIMETRYGDSEVAQMAYGAYVAKKDLEQNTDNMRKKSEDYWDKKLGKDYWKKQGESRKKAQATRASTFIDRSQNMHKKAFGAGSKSFW